MSGAGHSTTPDQGGQDSEAARLHGLLEPVVTAQGLFLEEVEIHRAGTQRTVQVLVDLPEDQQGGVSLDRIAEVSTDISAALDADPLDGPQAYELEVSSPGVSRPLTQPRHWRRNLGRLVRVKLSDAEPLTGRIREVHEDSVTLVPQLEAKKGVKAKEGAPVTVAFSTIRQAKVEIEFTHLDHAALDEALDPEETEEA
ncbi:MULTISPECIES: ribosome maturation factor RimP [Arthrobacter]|jgi:ribosome maturation factor RimP|uniref:Ribosome maturation factor RimP n=1 Tax=Arthrobacter woluwensis TaxID=156980 RepID=A0A1H4RS64_9MICC|nr:MULTISPECIES: ribosome maturation factor RimP [Arthrobacter]PSS45716.1 ribosome maturation factor RimP [Arthrobacter woluwensis]SEC34584.1 ribosome maturation factor RimP [Arthrobacter woluwensis]